MLRRRVLLASAAAPAAPALVARASLGQTPRKVKLGTPAFAAIAARLRTAFGSEGAGA